MRYLVTLGGKNVQVGHYDSSTTECRFFVLKKKLTRGQIEYCLIGLRNRSNRENIMKNNQFPNQRVFVRLIKKKNPIILSVLARYTTSDRYRFKYNVFTLNVL